MSPPDRSPGDLGSRPAVDRLATGPDLRPGMLGRPSFGYQRGSRVSIAQLRSMPHYADATLVDCVASGAISSRDFQDRYVKTRTPVVIREGVRHWDAWSRWDEEYLRRVAGDEGVPVTRCLDPGLPPDGADPGARPRGACAGGAARGLAACAWPTTWSAAPPGSTRRRPSTRGTSRSPCRSRRMRARLRAGRWRDERLHRLRGAALLYRFARASGIRYLRARCGGRRRSSCIPPTPRTTGACTPAGGRATGRRSDSSTSTSSGFPGSLRCRPHRAVLASGDALYIPDPWWHAVVSADDELEATVTVWFPPPVLRLSSPQTVRRFLRRPRTIMRAAWDLKLRV